MRWRSAAAPLLKPGRQVALSKADIKRHASFERSFTPARNGEVIPIHFRTAAIAAAVCVVAAALEGVAAGRSFRERLAELRLPRFSPSFPIWVMVGVGYYAIAATVLYRVLGLSSTSLRSAALFLIVAMLGINALWNYLFFRRRRPRSSFLLGLPYSLLALVLCLTLFNLDRLAGVALMPYVVYLLYANVWTYGVWQLNDRRTG